MPLECVFRFFNLKTTLKPPLYPLVMPLLTLIINLNHMQPVAYCVPSPSAQKAKVDITMFTNPPPLDVPSMLPKKRIRLSILLLNRMKIAIQPLFMKHDHQSPLLNRHEIAKGGPLINVIMLRLTCIVGWGQSSFVHAFTLTPTI